MQAQDLRSVLLIQAVEENDRAGELLTHAERIEATRATVRGERKPLQTPSGTRSSPAIDGFLARRAARLLERLSARAPAVGHVQTLAWGSTWVARIGLILAFVVGLSLAALDGSKRIDIVAFPLLGLIAWNLTVYLLLAISLLRRGRSPGKARAGAGRRPSLRSINHSWVSWRARALLRRSSQFNAPLSEALRRFIDQWLVFAQPLMLLRAKLLLHVGAALVLLGLLTGLYMRGIAMRYEAGWESTFLGPSGVRALLQLVYGPAAALSGIALPDSDDAVQRLRWDIGRGAEAAPWIHLIALTGALYVLIPRLLLALTSGIALLRRSRSVAAPPGLSLYARGLLLEAGESADLQGTAVVRPYAYAPGPDSIAGLQALLRGTLGSSARIEVQPPIAYGDEETFDERPGSQERSEGDWNVLLMNLAATPEAENHGRVLSGLCGALSDPGQVSPLLVVIDESAYTARMQGDPSLQERLDQRRTLWRDLVASHGLQACMVDLSHMLGSENQAAQLRDQVHSALWSPGRVPAT